MASSEPPEPPEFPEHWEVRTTSEGVQVSKSFDPDRFPVPAITFEIRSTRDVPVVVRLREILPREIPAEDLGFHADYGLEYWTVQDEVVTFEREFEPDEGYLTVYGLRSADSETIDRLLTNPEIDVAVAEEPTADPSGTDRSTAGVDATDEGGPIGDATIPAAATADDIALALAARLRHGEIDDADLDTLQDALSDRIEQAEGVDIGTVTPDQVQDPDRRNARLDTALKRPKYHLVTDRPPADLTDAEIDGELLDIAALSEAERGEYERRGHDIERRERELSQELDKRSAGTRGTQDVETP